MRSIVYNNLTGKHLLHSDIQQGNFVLEPRMICIGIEIEIVIEIDFWQLSDFDIDGCRPSLGSPCEHLAIYNYEIIESLRRTKMPCLASGLTCPVAFITREF
jgi:hypothetical protein